MMQLFYNDLAEVEEVLIKVSELSLAIQHQKDMNNVIKLTDGTREILGIQNILDYLNELDAELHLWHYCNC